MTKTTPQRSILREEEFTPLLQEHSLEFGRRVRTVLDEPAALGQVSFVGHLSEHADAIEAMLDDHGARQNRAFATLRELAASLRGLSRVKALGMLLIARLPRYVTEHDNLDLVSALGTAHVTLDRAITALCETTLAEAERLGLSWEGGAGVPAGDLSPRRLLPRDVDADLADDERQHIAQLGARFLIVIQASRQLGLKDVKPVEALVEFVKERATEDRCRWYESAVHNIQSMYDTYVQGTALEQCEAWLQVLRGHASVSLQLLEMATGLVHFYERHENEIRHESARERVASLVGKEDILNAAVNVCLRQAYLYVESASGTVDRILSTFVAERAAELELPEGVVLHARPLALIVKIARHHGTPLEVTIEGESCSATSLMDLIMLGGAHPRPKTMSFRGDERTLADLRSLFSAGLGEFGTEMPPELEYLKLRG